MLNATEIIKKMTEISNSFDMPKAYKEDLNIDFSLIKQAETQSNSTEYVWILRENGTCLIPLYCGANPVHVSAWESSDYHYFHIAGANVNQINFKFALSLANEFPFNPTKVTSMSQLMADMDRLLSGSIVQSSAFEVVHLTTSLSSWSDWQKWFASTKNTMMAEFMIKAIKQHKLLIDIKLAA
ncbi:hypothetical protein [Shewanella aestuarii]|uniref:Uncharacterized protein n=1 Tax=Shewanella aestuarii TaxID=1028752 RepID=A0A6G9QQF5_9GAMM|nr:hypothetical protein [Shewanella aestuarii]QIR16343.1 hypothetical protein HBH39_17815 [Shewanella aestuarii]